MKIERKGSISQNGFWGISAKLCKKGEPIEPEVNFIIDSGSEISILSPNIANSIGIKFNNLPSDSEIDIGNSGKCLARRLNDFDIILDHDDESDEFIVICKMYVPDENWKRPDFSLIGQDVLSQFDIKSDIRNKSILLTFVGNLSCILCR